MCRSLTLLTLCATVLTALATGTPAAPADGEEGLYQAARLYWDGDTPRAIEIWRRLSDEGDAIAACNIGVVYQRGEGVARDPGAAMRWYRVAAERDDAEAQYRLGLMYLSGDGVSVDAEEAHRWFTFRRAHHAHHHLTPQMQQWRREAAALIRETEARESLAASFSGREAVLDDLRRRAGALPDTPTRLSALAGSAAPN
jgi:hypothetical protein